MRRIEGTLRTFAALIAACFLCGCTPISQSSTEDTSAEVVPPVRQSADSSRAEGSRYIGVSSCAAAGCHGLVDASSDSKHGTASQSAELWRTAFWEWKERDPHSRAYHTLFSPRSQGIVRYLDPELSVHAPQYAAFLKQNCVGCHATGDEAATSGDQDHQGALLAWGVQCEACHGPARDWVTPHARAEWKALSLREREELGQRDTQSLTARAAGCVACHIGSPERPGREVTHDLIAGGHPRLQFEFSVYLANLPPHWNVEADRARVPQFEYVAWQTGQLVSADQTLSQLAARAKRAENRIASKSPSAWPEYAEYDCFACHHDLNSSRVRTPPASRIADLRWGNWYLALAPHWSAPGLQESLEPLERLMSGRNPSPTEVLAACEVARLQLQAAFTPDAPSAALTSPAAQIKQLTITDLPERGWSEAAQWSLAVTAFSRAQREETVRRGLPVSGELSRIDQSLHALQTRLAFPLQAGHQTGTADAFDFDSPFTFDPTETTYRTLLSEIRRELTALGQTAPR